MKEKDFDTSVKNALDRLEAPYDPASWAALERRMDAAFIEENPAPVDPVDKAVYHKLQQLEAPFQPDHWNLLAGRLAELRRLRLRLWAAKASELVIFLLLLVNLQGSWVEKSAVPAAKPRHDGPVAEYQKNAPGRDLDAPNRAKSPAEGSSADTGESFGTAWAVAPPFDPFHTGNNMVLPPEFSPAPDFIAAGPDALRGPLAAVQPMPVVFSPFALVPVRHLLPGNLYVAPPKARTGRLYWAAYASADQNNVRSAGDFQQSKGYSTGYALGYRRGKWGVETGIAYVQKHYEPKKKIEIYSGDVSNGYFGSYLGEVEADMVSVPLKVTRRVARMGRTTAHAVAGLTANVAVQKSYRYKTIRYPGSAPSSQGPNALAAQPQLRENGRGVLENGRLSENAYVSADLGLRLERPIAGRWTAFVEPTFRPSLSARGLGPDPARINTFSVQAGVMASL